MGQWSEFTPDEVDELEDLAATAERQPPVEDEASRLILTPESELLNLERALAKVKLVEAERNQARAALALVDRENDQLRQVAEYSTRPLNPPDWLTVQGKKSGEHRATLCLVTSDTHYTEVVNPAELGGINAFDDVIAETRLQRLYEKAVEVPRQYMAGVTFDGVVNFIAGDMLSGYLHDLQETNSDTQLAGMLHWTECLTAGIKLLADEYGKVHCPITVGNHGRLTRMPRTKLRVKDNLDWVIAQLLAKHFAKDERVTFQIPESIDVEVKVYDTKFLMYHGETGGGGGIGGIFPPIMRLKARKMTRYDFDVLVIGHWHQLIFAPDQGLIVNGSLKGWDEFAATMAFPPERPQQALWTVTPEHGITHHVPILVADRAKEGW